MKQSLLFIFMSASVFCNAQSIVQTLNSGSITGAGGIISVGEITVIPQNENHADSGFIAILVQINQQNLEVPTFEVSENIKVYPNPTMAKIFFESKQIVANEKISIINNVGQVVSQKRISGDNSLDLTDLATGTYLIQFSDENLKSFKIIKK